MSPPSRRRGSKPCVGERLRHDISRLLRGGVDRNLGIATIAVALARVASFAEAWIETSSMTCSMRSTVRRLLRGGVDRNFLRLSAGSQIRVVASFAEAWIETRASCRDERRRRVASFAEAWIETQPSRGQTKRP